MKIENSPIRDISGTSDIKAVKPVEKIDQELSKNNRDMPEDKIEFSDEIEELLKRAKEGENK